MNHLYSYVYNKVWKIIDEFLYFFSKSYFIPQNVPTVIAIDSPDESELNGKENNVIYGGRDYYTTVREDFNAILSSVSSITVYQVYQMKSKTLWEIYDNNFATWPTTTPVRLMLFRTPKKVDHISYALDTSFTWTFSDNLSAMLDSMHSLSQFQRDLRRGEVARVNAMHSRGTLFGQN